MWPNTMKAGVGPLLDIAKACLENILMDVIDTDVECDHSCHANNPEHDDGVPSNPGPACVLWNHQ